MKYVLLLTTVAFLALAPSSHATLTFVCPGGYVPDGPQQGAPMGIKC